MKYEYLRSFPLREDQGTREKLKKRVFKTCACDLNDLYEDQALQPCLHDNERYTVLKESKQIFYSNKNPLIINLKGKLQKPFNFFLRCKTRPIWLAHLLVKYHLVCCKGIGQLNCDNRSQQHFEDIYGSFDFINATRTS